MASKTISVQTGTTPGQRYDVVVGRGLVSSSLDGLVTKGQRFLLVRDANVPAAMISTLITKLFRRGVIISHLTIPVSEQHKSFATLERILTAAAGVGLERGDLMLAIGGGITTDVVGLAAGLHRRGCRVVHCPSTLLAMVDGSVGGKTAINLHVGGSRAKAGKAGAKAGAKSGGKLLKNAIGVFHQPVRVVCDVALLASLDARTFRSGLAECIKHGLLGGAFGDDALLGDTAALISGGVSATSRGLPSLIARNVALKAVVVGQDEREVRDDLPGGGRMALNLGHTFAHAIETLPGLSWYAAGKKFRGPLQHGEAVGLGLICATELSARLHLCKPELAELTRVLVGLAGLPVEVSGLPRRSEVVARMAGDKKSKGGKLRLVLVTDDRMPFIASDVPTGMIADVIRKITVS